MNGKAARAAILTAKRLADGGRITNAIGHHSKAAEVARNLPQAKGTVDQMLAMLEKRAVKPSELANAGKPFGNAITKEELAAHFDRALPKVRAVDAKPQFQDYISPGGTNYRERLLKLQRDPKSPWNLNDTRNSYTHDHWGTDHPNVVAHVRMQDRVERPDMTDIYKRFEPFRQQVTFAPYNTRSGSRGPDFDSEAEARAAIQGFPASLRPNLDVRSTGVRPTHQAIDRSVDKGALTPLEGATLARAMKQDKSKHFTAPGLDKKVLHVEEMQSDWGQQGRKKGFFDPGKPFHVFDTKTGETVAEHAAEDQAETDAIGRGGAFDYAHASESGKVPAGPYVGNTQHWTDLAMKHVMDEAAKGKYDKVVFTPGQMQADRFGLDKHVGRLQLLSHPSTAGLGTLNAWDTEGHKAFSHSVNDHDHLAQLIGHETADKLMKAERIAADTGFGWTHGTTARTLAGQDLHIGGEGMKGYYDGIVPKTAMRLMKQHDPAIVPSSMDLPEGHKGLAVDMTPTARESILKGQPAFARGGHIDRALQLTSRYSAPQTKGK